MLTTTNDDPNLYLIPWVEAFHLTADGEPFELRVNYPRHAMRILPQACENPIAVAHVIVAWWNFSYNSHGAPCPLVEVFPDAFQARPGWDVYYGGSTLPLASSE